MKELLALDLCCGAGGWAVAARGLPVRFAAVADLAADCLETWSLNNAAAHPGCATVRCDLSTPAGLAEALAACAGGVDLVLGGIPCEEVSRARGNRPLKAGQLDRLHALVDNCFTAVTALRPRWWCFEDVEAIERHLPPPLVFGAPYEVRKVCSGGYGPQRRRRVFIGSFPALAAAEPGPRTLGEVLRPGPYRTLPSLAKYKRGRGKWYGTGTIRVQEGEAPAATVASASHGRSDERGVMAPLARVLDAGEPCPTVADFGSRHERAALVPVGEAPRFGAESVPGVGQKAHVVRTGRGREAPVRQPAAQSRACAAGAAAPTVTGSLRCDPLEAVDGEVARVMEWQEAALLQGFPPDFVFAASWSRTWKLVAQAIPIQVGRAVLRGVVAQAEGG